MAPVLIGFVKPSFRSPTQRAEVRVNLSDLSVSTPDQTSSDEIALVVFESLINVKIWHDLRHRQDITYWAAKQVHLPTGEIIEAADADDLLINVANDAFEDTLPPGATPTVSSVGQKTWKVAVTSVDWRHAIHVFIKWAWFVVLGATAALWIAYATRERLARKRIARQCCWCCGYDLSGSPCGICEECGEADQRPA